jgi:hypothetical protein
MEGSKGMAESKNAVHDIVIERKGAVGTHRGEGSGQGDVQTKVPKSWQSVDPDLNSRKYPTLWTTLS